MAIKKLPFSLILFMMFMHVANVNIKADGIDFPNTKKNFLLYDEYTFFISSELYRNVFKDYNVQIEWKTIDYHSFTIGFGYYTPRKYVFSNLLNSQKIEVTTVKPGLRLSFQFRQYFDYEFEGIYMVSGVSYSFLPGFQYADFLVGAGWMYLPNDFLAVRAEIGPTLRFLPDIPYSYNSNNPLQLHIHWAFSVGILL